MRTSSTTRSRAPQRGWALAGLLASLAVAACDGSGETATDAFDEDDGADGGAPSGDGDDGADDGEGDEDDESLTSSVGAAGGAEGCAIDADCDDGDDCTRDACDTTVASEFTSGVCAHEAIAGCVPADEPADDPPADDPANPVDPTCAEGGGDAEAVFLPYVPLGAPDVPASCGDGFEWQNCTTSFDQLSVDHDGAAAVRLVVDLATYTAPDWLRIVATSVDGEEEILLDTCRVRTAEYSDPTDGASRPPDETIRRFHLEVPAGTRKLTFDSSRAPTPFYMRVLGLCDFELAGPTSCSFRTTG